MIAASRHPLPRRPHGESTATSRLPSLSVRTRLVEHADASALLEIYNPEVIETTVTFDVIARTMEEQLEWIDAHRGAHPAIVAVADPDEGNLGHPGARGERVVGYACLGPYRPRAAYATTVEDSLYVDRSARGRGIGRLLLEDLLAAGIDGGFHSVIARIVGENQASIDLHVACGFEMVGIEREVGRKHGRWLDVVELQRLL